MKDSQALLLNEEGCKLLGWKHHMVSIKTGSEVVQYVERCNKCGWIDPEALEQWAENAIKLSLTKRAQRIGVAASTEPFAFVQSPDQELTLQEVLYQALGAASVCWEHPEGAGVFDSDRAAAIGRALEAEVQRFCKLAQT